MGVFTISTGTPLYSSAWMPTSVNAYAATCIYLIVLGAIFRCLAAARSVLERRSIDADFNSRNVILPREQNDNERVRSDMGFDRGRLVENGVEENIMIVRRRIQGVMPWRITTDGPRALIDVVYAGVLYLLMVSIMAMDLGYFLAVLCGIFLGSLATGRYGGWERGEVSLHG
ncbi:hypothetical protein NKR19_g10169 [Coniochaeta hoffmannii]|uniref:Copper transport protein n=1 Tax=Coniochaeta hoffmannii TaxID=91930 RepID=A0AA38RG14_9PEZI|nr:hypothetical protein NKR19_g10169 [Coniochaeta hoffmannii]